MASYGELHFVEQRWTRTECNTSSVELGLLQVFHMEERYICLKRSYSMVHRIQSLT